MSQELIFTLVGPDKRGVVAELAEVVAENDGNWLESRLSHLGGAFAGVVRVEFLVEKNKKAFQENLGKLKEKGYVFEFRTAKQPERVEFTRARLNLSGKDQKGIVKQVFQALSEFGINVEELETKVRGAPWSGHLVFEAEAALYIPEGVDTEDVQQRLEDINHDLLVEIELA